MGPRRPPAPHTHTLTPGLSQNVTLTHVSPFPPLGPRAMFLLFYILYKPLPTPPFPPSYNPSALRSLEIRWNIKGVIKRGDNMGRSNS